VSLETRCSAPPCSLLDAANNIVGDDVTVSRRHAEFLCERSEFRVFDVGRLNGMYVNGEPLRSTVLTNDDEIRLGKFRLVLLVGLATG
jgi:pSer/pThr/pTyr-binding forkhead associated (FHA) protein